MKKKKTAAKKPAMKTRISDTAIAVILGVCAVLLLLLFLCVSPFGNISGAGVLLQYFVKIFASFFGLARYILPFYLLLLAYAFFCKKKEEFRFVRFVIFSTVAFLVFPAFFCINQHFISFGSFMVVAADGTGGGMVGGLFAYFMLLLFNKPVSVAILIFLLIISVILLTNFSVISFLRDRKESYRERKEEKQAREALFDEEDNANEFFPEEAEEKESLLSKLKFKSADKEEAISPGKKKRKVVEYAEKNDACLVKMASGKVWVLEKMILGVPTRQFINSKPNEIVE
ncbi:MAG: DNA translocase FtsK 4TM domain-containing protein, partial [Christensenellaceae bacterium]|nr:DNA translocase FtsK 4TM domain-containing protein [Christensenellaceae bacterium]